MLVLVGLTKTGAVLCVFLVLLPVLMRAMRRETAFFAFMFDGDALVALKTDGTWCYLMHGRRSALEVLKG